MRCLDVHVCVSSPSETAIEKPSSKICLLLELIFIIISSYYSFIFPGLCDFLVILFHDIIHGNPALHIILSQYVGLFLSLFIYVLCCLYWPCWVFSVELILLIIFTASLEFCLTCKIGFSFVSSLFTVFFYRLHVKSIKTNTKWNKRKMSLVLSAGLYEENVP